MANELKGVTIEYDLFNCPTCYREELPTPRFSSMRLHGQDFIECQTCATVYLVSNARTAMPGDIRIMYADLRIETPPPLYR